MVWKQVLETTQDSPSDEFVSLSGQMHAVCDVHNGGDWTLEFKAPSGNWVEIDDVVFDDEDSYRFFPPQGATMRFTGGTTGASIYVNGVQ